MNLYTRNKYRVAPTDERRWRGKIYASKTEMQYAQELADRVAGKLAGVSGRVLDEGPMLEDSFDVLQQGIIKLANAKLYIHDSAKIGVASMHVTARRMIALQQVDCIMVDHLGLIEPPDSRETNRVQQVSAISRGLKIMARELNVPVIVACQLNRLLEARKDKKPILSDLRDSGAIEQDADIVLLLHRDERCGNDRGQAA